MPWKSNSLEAQRLEVVSLCLVEGANRSEIARRFGVSRKTLYKWLAVSQSDEPLTDRSRRPRRSPGRSSPETEERVLKVREAHPVWGGRKIAKVIESEVRVSPSTVTEILRRHGRLQELRAGGKRAYQRFVHEHPNELWQMDFKGHFPTLLEGRCHPFDVLDDHSRYCLRLTACTNERWLTVQEHLSETFRTYGLPLRILCDNGGCWGATSAREITPLTIWLSRLGIKLIHGKPYHPQTQGKLERFHLTLKREVLDGHSFRDLEACTKAFIRYRDDYNRLRPHDELALATPASRYRISALKFPEGALKEPEYDEGALVRIVQKGGVLCFAGEEFRVGKCLHGLRVEVRPFKERDGRYEVRYGRTRIEIIDLRESTPRGV